MRLGAACLAASLLCWGVSVLLAVVSPGGGGGPVGGHCRRDGQHVQGRVVAVRRRRRAAGKAVPVVAAAPAKFVPATATVVNAAPSPSPAVLWSAVAMV